MLSLSKSKCSAQSPKFANSETNELEKIPYFSLLPKELVEKITDILDLKDNNHLNHTSKTMSQLVFNNNTFWGKRLFSTYGINIKNIDTAKYRILKDLYKDITLTFNTKYKQSDFKFLMQQKKSDNSEYTYQEIIEIIETLEKLYKECPKSEELLSIGIIKVEDNTAIVKNLAYQEENRCIRHFMIDKGYTFEAAKKQSTILISYACFAAVNLM